MFTDIYGLCKFPVFSLLSFFVVALGTLAALEGNLGVFVDQAKNLGWEKGWLVANGYREVLWFFTLNSCYFMTLG